MTEEAQEGAVLSGRYRVEHLLGEGGMGVVYAAQHLLTLRPVAIKLLKGATAHDAAVRKRFLREARAACAVSHPNIVEILDVFQLDDGAPVMVMERLEGESLAKRLTRLGSLPLDEVARILLPVTSAVGAAHAAGIVHRDLKPDNVFLARLPDGSERVKVLDFGIAKVVAIEGEGGVSAALTGTGAMLGTPYYMSPEQVFGEKDIDHRSDLWALGVMLYECLCGVRPTEGPHVGAILKVIMTDSIVPLEQRAKGLPDEIYALCKQLLSRDRNARPPSMHDVALVLQTWADVAVPSFGPPVHLRSSQDVSSPSQPSTQRQLAEIEAAAARVRTGDGTVDPLQATSAAPSDVPPRVSFDRDTATLPAGVNSLPRDSTLPSVGAATHNASTRDLPIAPVAPKAKSRGRVIAIGAAALAAVTAGGAWIASRNGAGPTNAAASASAASGSTSTAPAAASASELAKPVGSSTIGASALSASASNDPPPTSAPSTAATNARPAPSASVVRVGSAAASASSHAAATASAKPIEPTSKPAPSATTTTPGGIIEKAPF